MTDPQTSRDLSCAACGRSFGCTLDGHCWCAAETFRLPMPEMAAQPDCLCPSCLRQLAAQQAATVPTRTGSS